MDTEVVASIALAGAVLGGAALMTITTIAKSAHRTNRSFKDTARRFIWGD